MKVIKLIINNKHWMCLTKTGDKHFLLKLLLCLQVVYKTRCDVFVTFDWFWFINVFLRTKCVDKILVPLSQCDSV